MMRMVTLTTQRRNFLLVLQILLPLMLLFTISFSPPPASNHNSFAMYVADRSYFKQKTALTPTEHAA